MICDENKRMEKMLKRIIEDFKVRSQTSQLDLRPVIVIQDFETLFHAFDEQAILSDWQKNSVFKRLLS